MRQLHLVLFLMCSFYIIQGQGNCNLFEGICRDACELSYEAKKRQGTKTSQELFDKCIEMCPSFAYAYFEKSVPYLKQGLYKEWKELMDKAVEYDPEYLLNRGCNQIQFIRNYEAGLNDLDELVELRKTIDIGFSPSGEYHAQFLRALCHRKLGDSHKAVALIEELINSKTYHQGPYDYFHFGILYMDIGDYNKAKQAFDKQIEHEEKAETYFYYAMIFKKENDTRKQKEMLEKARDMYANGRTMTNVYFHYIDKIFEEDIEEALSFVTDQ